MQGRWEGESGWRQRSADQATASASTPEEPQVEAGRADGSTTPRYAPNTSAEQPSAEHPSLTGVGHLQDKLVNHVVFAHVAIHWRHLHVLWVGWDEAVGVESAHRLHTHATCDDQVRRSGENHVAACTPRGHAEAATLVSVTAPVMVGT